MNHPVRLFALLALVACGATACSDTALVVRVAGARDGAIVVAVGAARVAVRAGFDPVLLRQVVMALGEGR